MRKSGARRIAWRALILSLFALTILARNATGAPNVQVAFPGFVHKAEVIAAESLATVLHPSPVESFSCEDSAHKHYKKYLCPDRMLDSGFPEEFDSFDTSPLCRFERWNFSSVPLSIQAHAPPMTDQLMPFISPFVSQGAFSIEVSVIDQCGWGIGLDGLRTL